MFGHPVLQNKSHLHNLSLNPDVVDQPNHVWSPDFFSSSLNWRYKIDGGNTTSQQYSLKNLLRLSKLGYFHGSPLSPGIEGKRKCRLPFCETSNNRNKQA